MESATYKAFNQDTNGVVDRYSEHVVAAAVVLGLHVVLVGNTRIFPNKVLHGCLRDNIATSSMAKSHRPDQGDNAEVFLLVWVELPERIHQIWPGDVRVCIDKDVPVIAGSQSVGLFSHVDILVLVKVPSCAIRALDVLDTAILVNGTLFLQAVEIKVAIVLLGLVENRLEAVTDAVAADALLEIGKEEEIGETFQGSHYLHG